MPHDWQAEDLARGNSWHFDFGAPGQDALQAARAALDTGPGFAVVSNLPVPDLTTDEHVKRAVDLVALFGSPLPQGPEGDTTLGWLVRDEGVSRFDSHGMYVPNVYTSKSADFLDIHNDDAMHPYGHNIDIFALFCLSASDSGGGSTLVSSRRVYSVLRDEYPEQFERLCQPFPFERAHVTHSGQDPVISAPVFERVEGRLRVHCNRQRIEMAMATMPDSYGADEEAALDALESVLSRDELQLRLRLGRGDLLIVDDHLVLHGRDSFTDAPGGTRRCLIRILLERHPSGAVE